MLTTDISLSIKQKVIFAAMSKKSFYLREHIIKFILEQGFTPTCAFMMFSYFLLDTVDRKALIQANNNLIRKSDELWVFGPLSDGVQEEVKLAKKLHRSICYFKVNGDTDCKFVSIKESEAEVEE